MGTTKTNVQLADASKTQANVEHHERPTILVPEALTMRQAAGFCEKKAIELEAMVFTHRGFTVLPWVGALATWRTLERLYSSTCPDADWIQVPVAGGELSVPWGVHEVAGLGTVQTASEWKDGRPVFRLSVHARRMDEDKVQALLDRVRDTLDDVNLYAGCAIILKPDEEGRLSLDSPPQVVQVEDVDPDDIILPAALAAALRAELFLPIQAPDRLVAAGLPLRRGVLLAGRPGTGKTMSARAAASLAVREGFGVWYLPDARAIEGALAVAQAHAPAVLIVEDIDRHLGGERNALTDRILNALDGLDRSAHVVVVATSNAPEALPAPLLRPGRLDSVLLFGPPDVNAAGQLLALYLGEAFTGDPLELEPAATVCAGASLLPSSVREVASRAKLHALEADDAGVDVGFVTPSAVEAAALAVSDQQALVDAAEDRPMDVPTLQLVTADRGDKGNALDRKIRSVPVTPGLFGGADH